MMSVIRGVLFFLLLVTSLKVTSLTACGQQAVATAEDLLQLEQKAFTNAVQAAAGCVVQIETFGGVDKGDKQSMGDGPVTGTIVGEDGWIVSSLYSFRQTPASILVTLPEGNRVPARIVARDYSREIALLKVEASQPLPVANPAEVSGLQVGQWCIALGKTYDSRSVTQSMGIVSALGRAYGRAVQTDAKISPINYGGPLIDLNGKVIGVLSPIAAAQMLEDDPSMLYDSGIGFAIPLQDIAKRLPKLKEGKDVRPGRLGVVLESQNELVGPVKLTGAAPGTPAGKAGVKSGDVLVEAGGSKIELLADLRAALAQADAGEKFSFAVRRGAERVELSCELTAEIPIYRRRYLGLKVKPVELGLQIITVDAKSPAESAGLKPDQILTDCDGKPLKKKLDLYSQVAVCELDSNLKLLVIDQPGGASRPIAVQPSTWPTELIAQTPAKVTYVDTEGKEDPNAATTVTQLKLADIPNQVHIILPPQANRNASGKDPAQQRQLGCLLLFPEPGPVEPEKLKSQWDDLAKNYGWIVVVPTSANPKNWSRDEATELPTRLIARLAQEYDLDRTRTVVAGLGIGGQLALRTAITASNQFPAVLTINTPLRPFAVPRQNMPMQTVDFLIVGAKMEPVAEQLNKLGFVANSLNPPGLDLAKWSAVPMDAIIKWLESLGHI